MKGFGCPKGPLSLLGLINEIGQFTGLLIIDNGHSTWPLFDNQPINAARVETIDPLAQRAIGDQQSIAKKTII